MLIETTLAAIGLAAGMTDKVAWNLVSIPAKALFFQSLLGKGRIRYALGQRLATSRNVNASKRRLEVWLACLVVLKLDNAEGGAQLSSFILGQLKILDDIVLFLRC